MYPLLPPNRYGFLAHTGAAQLVDPNQPPEIKLAQSQAKVDAFRHKHRLPGLAAVIVNADTIHCLCSGQRRIDAAALIQANDTMPLGALSKAVTATVLARWVEQGRLRWDSTLAELLPAWRDQMQAEFQTVTLQQLLEHRAGLARDFDDLNYPQLLTMLGGQLSAERSTAAHWILQQAPAYPINQRTRYSNLGYLILGIIIELIGGNTYEKVIQTQLLATLHLQPQIGQAAAIEGHQATKTYWFSKPQWRTAEIDADEHILARLKPRIRLSPADYGVFLREHLRGLHGLSTLLSLHSFQQLHTAAAHYALGWACIQTAEHGQLSVHDSAEHGFRHYSVLMPDRQRAVAIFCNADDASCSAKLIQLAESLLTES